MGRAAWPAKPDTHTPPNENSAASTTRRGSARRFELYAAICKIDNGAAAVALMKNPDYKTAISKRD